MTSKDIMISIIDYKKQDNIKNYLPMFLFFIWKRFFYNFITIKTIFAVNVVDGEVLSITKVSRLHMGAYLCIASNGVPPSISKRVMLMVQCKIFILLKIPCTFQNT